MPLKKRKKLKTGSKIKVAKRFPIKRKAVVRKKNPAARKAVKGKRGKRAAAPRKRQDDAIGVVTHYFPKVRAAAIVLKAPLAVGQAIKVKGHTTDFTQVISSMQIDHVPIQIGKQGQEIGLQVSSRVRRRDRIYRA